VKLPIMRRPEILPRGIQDSFGGGAGLWNGGSVGVTKFGASWADADSVETLYDGGAPPLFPSVALLGTAIVIIYFGAQIYRRRGRPRRRRVRLPPASRRARTVPFAVRVT
jgi:hypothetical protein